MARKALSNEKHQQIKSKEKEKWLAVAIQRYQDEHNDAENSKPRGAEAVIDEVQAECYRETNNHIRLSSTTLLAQIDGRQGIRQFNAEKSWLTEEETEVVLTYATNLADRGFPLSHRRLREHVNQICFAKYKGRRNSKFPKTGVGKSWVSRFLTKHSERLRPYWSHSLDQSRARAVNPVTKAQYYEELHKVLDGEVDGEPISVECLYGVDETGFQEGIGQKELVLAAPGKTVQHQQRSGNRENITAIVTICADGTSIPPAIIYKAEAFHVSWLQDNPLKASLGYSRKGYTTGEIGATWLKHFDQQTRDKAAGRAWLLLVDGHNSHYTREFLEYASENKIHVLCYPSHATHVYQGLDVVIFSVLKKRWSEARDKFERETGGVVNKSNFLKVYAEVHNATLTKDNIIAAFRKTGVVPFNPDVVTEAMMAPSLETSTTGVLPITPPSPVRAVIKWFGLEMQERSAENAASPQHADGRGEAGDGEPGARSQLASEGADARNTFGLQNIPVTPVRSHIRLDALASTSASFLVSPSPVKSSSAPPAFVTSGISPFIRGGRYQDLLSHGVRTEHEVALCRALQESDKRDETRKKSLASSQATNILHGLYTSRLQRQLQTLEEKKNCRTATHLGFNGTSKLLTDPEFVQQQAECLDVHLRKEADKAERRARRQVHADQLAQWKIGEDGRKARVAQQRAGYRAAITEWESNGKRGVKPKLGALEKAAPRPKLNAGTSSMEVTVDGPIEEHIDDGDEESEDSETE